MASQPTRQVQVFNDRPIHTFETRAGDALTALARRHRERINCWLLGASLGVSAVFLGRAALALAVWAAHAAGIA